MSTEPAADATAAKCPHCGGDHEVCPGCGKHPDQIATTEPANTPAGAESMPDLTALYCLNCGYWILLKGAEPQRFLIRDVPSLSPWVAFFMGILMTRQEEQRRAAKADPLSMVLEILRAGPPKKKDPNPEPSQS